MKSKGQMVTGDFQENTVTIEIDEPIILKSGEYMVISIEKYKEPEMLDMLKEILEAQESGEVFHSYKIEQLIKEATEI